MLLELLLLAPRVTRDDRAQSKSIFTSRKAANGGQQLCSHGQKAACFSRGRKCLSHGRPAPTTAVPQEARSQLICPPMRQPPPPPLTHVEGDGCGGPGPQRGREWGMAGGPCWPWQTLLGSSPPSQELVSDIEERGKEGSPPHPRGPGAMVSWVP